MPWVTRSFSKGDIDRAGKSLVALAQDDPAREDAIAIVDNWRSCHAYPLQIIKMTLKNRARKIDKDALIAQRLKRRPSIELKLRDNPNMKLSQMQDIGGCRAVLKSAKQVQRLVRRYKKYDAKSPKDRSSWDGSEAFDYILHPKPDGYRSVHLIFRFQSPSADRKCFNGQRIEIQIRSKLQHLWATAVETAQVFTGQALKSKYKNATEEWIRFFSLTSSAFALRERCAPVPGTPDSRDELINELRRIMDSANIMNIVWGWNSTIHLLEERLDAKKSPDAYVFLLALDPTQRSLIIKPFSRDKLEAAQAAYEEKEKETESDPNIQVVLVAVEDVDALRKAYPNYYADTSEFMAAIELEINQ